MSRLIDAKITEEIIQLAVSYCQDGQHPDDLEKDLRNLITIAPTIEADSGEPVGYANSQDLTDMKVKRQSCNVWHKKYENCDVELYTSPQKQWVELTDSDINNLAYQSRNDVQGVTLGHTTQEQYFGKLISAKLKEVNHG